MTGSQITLILGGARSGKSRLAEQLVTDYAPPWIYIATAEPRDAEMRHRIEDHQQRRGQEWNLIEEPVDLALAIETAQQSAQITLVDCLTLWLSNLLERDLPVKRCSDELLSVLCQLTTPVIMVSNQVGDGIVPGNAVARRFRDEAGVLNRKIADIADRVLLVIAGQVVMLKDPSVSANQFNGGGFDGQT
jgi:adenosylcobinamide kinase/adenosylcobinamide-phosphate guanylyltransferase